MVVHGSRADSVTFDVPLVLPIPSSHSTASFWGVLFLNMNSEGFFVQHLKAAENPMKL